jgi:glyoxylase-like metal-dependent hydrolase (beta-lactamase superfamily II)
MLGAVTRTELPEYDIVGLRADNPGPFSLTGTNTWIIGRDPAWIVDPGPALAPHVERISAELTARGGAGAIVLTHDHYDHAEAVPALRERFPEAPLAAARGAAEIGLTDGTEVGPLRAFATPGHASDHFSFLTGPALITGDAVLGQGSVFIAPDPGALAGYLAALARLRELPLDVILPGHGPVVTDPIAKLDEYRRHRLEREQRLVAALDAGRRTVDELLDAAWSEVPDGLRPAAAVTLAAHLDKLADEGRLPTGVERPEGIEALLRAASGAT